jgi:hypothetical protein
MLWDIPDSTNGNVIPGISVPCCGLELRITPRHLSQLKTFYLNTRWARTLPSVGNFSLDISRAPRSQKQIQISKLMFDTLLWAWGAKSHPCTYKTVKDPCNNSELNPKWERTLPSVGNCFAIFIDSRPKEIQISKLIFDTLLWAWGAESHPGT